MKVKYKMELFLVVKNGKPFVAYPRKIQAKVYATGMSTDKGIEIIKGIFYPDPALHSHE